MDALLSQATRILNTARRIAPDGGNVAIFLDGEDGVRIVSDFAGNLGSAARHYGARSAYQVMRSGGRVAVEAVSEGRRGRVGPPPRRPVWMSDRHY